MISYVILRVRTQSMCVQWMKNPLVWKYRARLCYNSHKKPMDNHSRSCAFFFLPSSSFNLSTYALQCVSLKNHVWFIEYWRIKRNNIYIYWENIKCEATSLHLKCSLFIMRFVDLFAAVNHFSNTTQTIECIDSVLNFDLSTTFRFGHILEPLSLILDEISKHTHTHMHTNSIHADCRVRSIQLTQKCALNTFCCAAQNFYLLKNSIVWDFSVPKRKQKADLRENTLFFYFTVQWHIWVCDRFWCFVVVGIFLCIRLLPVNACVCFFFFLWIHLICHLSNRYGIYLIYRDIAHTYVPSTVSST